MGDVSIPWPDEPEAVKDLILPPRLLVQELIAREGQDLEALSTVGVQ